MSLTYHRIKMRMTTLTVASARKFVDGCNLVIHTAIQPMRLIAEKVGAEAPWLSGAVLVTLMSMIPLVLYPYMRPMFKDRRMVQEEERVRLCLQKGIDPYPMMQYKNMVQGRSIPSFVDDEKVSPDDAYEYEAIGRLIRRKEELRKQVGLGADVDVTVRELLALKEEQKKLRIKKEYSTFNDQESFFRKDRDDKLAS